MLAINLEPELEKLLINTAERSGLSLDSFVREAIERMIEDQEDIALLEEALRDPGHGETISSEQMKRELGLDN
jgi:RHH-type transcriptional regulator, rel operon repressor / antitoxin RelB